MADVFISYHEKSAGELVKQIAAALENVGVSCWYAERNLIAPGSFAATITQEIRACKVFLLVLDNDSNQSEHVKSEVYLAFQRISKHENMKPFYFKIDNCSLSDDMVYYLSRFQITDGNPPDQEHIQKLANQVSDIIQPEPPTWEMIRKQQQRIRELESKVQDLTNYIQVLTEYKGKSEELEAKLYERIQYDNHKQRTIEAVRIQILEQAAEQARLLEQANPISSVDWVVGYRSFSYASRSDALKRIQQQVQVLAEEQAHKMELIQKQILEQANEQANLLEKLQYKSDNALNKCYHSKSRFP